MRRHKYNAVRTWEQGHWFDSKKEAARYQELLLLEKAGEITELELQPRFDLLAWRADGAPKVGVYVADFRYREAVDGRNIVEDVKGVRTAEYKFKKRFMKAQYGITISEV